MDSNQQKKKYTEDNIRVVSALEAVRLRPRMYFEACYRDENLNFLVFESLCHAFDEYFDGNCDEITVTIWNKRFTVRYNAEMPLKRTKVDGLHYPEAIMTRIYTCSNLKKHISVGEEFCRIGMSQINFGSEKIKLTTVSENQKGVFIFKDGKTEAIAVETFETDESWTEIEIVPSSELFNGFELTSEGVQSKVSDLEAKLPGLKFTLVNNID